MKTNGLKMTQVLHIAFECLETAMKWLERQMNADPIKLMYLRRNQGMAALKECILCSKQQSKAFLLKFLSLESDKKGKKILNDKAEKKTKFFNYR